MSERIKWVDVAKGILILLVVVGHVISSYWTTGLYNDLVVYKYISKIIYSFHMPAFMFISGFLFKRYSSKSIQYKKIILNYGVPYVFFSVLWWLLKTFLSSFTNSQLSIKDILLIPFIPISFMWFLYALMIICLVQTSIQDIFEKRWYLHLGIGGILFFLQYILKDCLLFDIKFSDYIISDFMKMYIFFLIGKYIGDNIISIISSHKAFVLVLGMFLLIFNMLIINGVMPTNIILQFILSLMGIVFIVDCGILIQSKMLVFLGRRTIAIYVLQGIAISATRIVITKIGFNDKWGVAPLFICTVFGIIIPLICYHISTKLYKLDFLFTPGKYINFKE